MIQEVLFDRDLLRQNKARAQKNFHEHNFLHHEIANRIAENIAMLNRNFERVLEIGAMRENNLNNHFHQLTKQDFVNYIHCEDSENPAIESEAFDLILSNLNLHYVNQVPQFLLQMRDALKPNGVFIASFFGEENLSELAHVLHETENEIYGGISPRMPPTIDVKTAAHLLQKAGFRDPTSEFTKIEVDYSDPKNLLKDLKNMGQSNVLTKRSRRFMTKNFLEKIAQNYRQMYPNSDGGVRATFEVITITGWK